MLHDAMNQLMGRPNGDNGFMSSVYHAQHISVRNNLKIHALVQEINQHNRTESRAWHGRNGFRDQQYNSLQKLVFKA